jgi:3-methyl-2-oxobutanoate hydroxymethyltransferase
MPTEVQPVTIPDFLAWKSQHRRISILTAYDFPTARLLDAAGVDCLLVGDSLGTVVQGCETTLRVSIRLSITLRWFRERPGALSSSLICRL